MTPTALTATTLPALPGRPGRTSPREADDYHRNAAALVHVPCFGAAHSGAMRNGADRPSPDKQPGYRRRGGRRSKCTVRRRQRPVPASTSITMREGPPKVRFRPAAPGLTIHGRALRSMHRRWVCP